MSRRDGTEVFGPLHPRMACPELSVNRSFNEFGQEIGFFCALGRVVIGDVPGNVFRFDGKGGQDGHST